MTNGTDSPIVATPELPGHFATPRGPGVVIPPGRTGQIPEGNFSVGGSGNYCTPGKDSFQYTRGSNGYYSLQRK